MDETQKNLDINALLEMLPPDDEPIETDPERSAFEMPPPVPDDWYVTKLGIVPKSSSQFKVGDKTYANVKVMARIMNEGSRTNNNVAFQTESSKPGYDGKPSRIGSILKELGYKSGTDYHTHTEMLTLFAQVMATEPVCMAKTQWVLNVDTGLTDEVTGKKIYGTIYKGMKKFPVNTDGSYNPAPTGTFPAKYWDKNAKAEKTVEVALDGSQSAQTTIVAYKAVS